MEVITTKTIQEKIDLQKIDNIIYLSCFSDTLKKLLPIINLNYEKNNYYY